MSYQPTENYDVLLGLGMSAAKAEALDCMLQDGYVEELSSTLLEKFADMEDTVALECVTKIKSSGRKNVPDSELHSIVDQFCGLPTEEIEVNEVKQEPEPKDEEKASSVSSTSQTKTQSPTVPTLETKEKDSEPSFEINFGPFDSTRKGPDSEKLQKILDESGYPHEVKAGLRKYGGPPPGMDSQRPGLGTEVFVSRIPKDIFEDVLIPMFASVGKIWEMRLLVNDEGFNRGHGFVTYCEKSSAKKAVKQFDSVQVRPGWKLNVKLSVPFNRLFVRNIPRSKTREELKQLLTPVVESLLKVTFRQDRDWDSDVNEGSCHLVFDSYFEASNALKALKKKGLSIPGWPEFSKDNIDWTIPTENPDDEAFEKASTVKVSQDSNKIDRSVWSEDMIRSEFSQFGDIEKIMFQGKHYSVHFKTHDSAVKAIETKNNSTLADLNMQVSMIVPISEYAARKRSEMKKIGRFGCRTGRRVDGVQVNKPKVDARKILERKTNLASRIGGPSTGITPPGDMRSQLGLKRKQPMATAPPVIHVAGIKSRIGGKVGGQIQHHSQPQYLPPRQVKQQPFEENREALMEELLMLKRREHELTRSMYSMEPVPAKRMFSGPSSAYSAAMEMGLESRAQLAPRMDPAMPSRLSQFSRQPMLYEDEFAPPAYTDNVGTSSMGQRLLNSAGYAVRSLGPQRGPVAPQTSNPRSVRGAIPAGNTAPLARGVNRRVISTAPPPVNRGAPVSQLRSMQPNLGSASLRRGGAPTAGTRRPVAPHLQIAPANQYGASYGRLPGAAFTRF